MRGEGGHLMTPMLCFHFGSHHCMHAYKHTDGNPVDDTVSPTRPAGEAAKILSDSLLLDSRSTRRKT